MSDLDSFDATSPLRDQKGAPGSGDTRESPEKIARYRIEQLLGEGGFGRVYLARDGQLQRLVAIKVPHAKLVSRPEDAELYLAEARTVAGLDHPSIVPVHDIGSTAEYPYFVVSKYIDGKTLSQFLEESAPAARYSADVIAVVAEALHHAHQRGLVHRDIKPSNILLDTNGKPHVVDFGLALEEKDVGKGLRYAGTPSYMSPEQARGEGHRVDGRTDVYSLGAVFYEMLVGRRTFTADTQAELFRQIISQEVKPPRQIDDRVPKELERICLRALSKRASERYTTARDMAEDLRQFLAGQPEHFPAAPHETLAGKPYESTRVDGDIGKSQTRLGSDSQPIRIVPKGLRSFDEHDADFFLELLPGPRDRAGLPDSVRFWKTRIEETDCDATFSVGLIYGPSGCGKSSLVRAGLLPRLADHVKPIFVEATHSNTEARLLNGLRKHFPDLPSGVGLKESMTALRLIESKCEKVVIILDQFEQWLHGNRDREQGELVQALRQCNGSKVQCIVLVRDDFWMAATRFMRDLEVPLVEGQNSAAVDLFPVRHAQKVLAAFGLAFGAIPDAPNDAAAEQRRFVSEAVKGLSTDGKVICVRLALFAEMMKGRAWTRTSLREVGGTEGIGSTFLEETFSVSTAPPKHRLHQKAARAVLKSLLPESGSNIKGHMKSSDELRRAARYERNEPDYNELMQILDGELRLITPTDPEGIDISRQSADLDNERPHYQLAHDYLVPSLRKWLTRKQKETRRGRAELRLADREAIWNAKPENRHLPSLWEYLSIRTFVNASDWTAPQKNMMRLAGRRYATHFAIFAAVVAAIIFSAVQLKGNFQADAIVDRLLSANQQELELVIADGLPYRHWVRPRLNRLLKNEPRSREDARRTLHARIALLRMGDESQLNLLRQDVLTSEISYIGVLRNVLKPHQEKLLADLWKKFHKESAVTSERFRAGLMLADFAPDSKRWKESDTQFLVAQFASTNPIHQAVVWDCLRNSSDRLKSHLEDICIDSDATDSARIAAANAVVDLNDEDPHLRTRVIVQATPAQYRILYPHLDKSDATTRQQMERLVQRQPTRELTADQRVTLGRRRAGASITLLRQGEIDIALECLRVRDDPESLTQFVHRCRERGVSIGQLIKCLDRTIEQRRQLAGTATVLEDRVVFGVLLALGEFGISDVPSDARTSLVSRLARMYEEDPSACVHSATGWLLRKWQQQRFVDAVDQSELPYSQDRGWFVRQVDVSPEEAESGDNSERSLFLTFVVIEPGEYTIGSPPHELSRSPDEPMHTVVLKRRVAVLDREITRAEYELYSGKRGRVTVELSPTGDHPIVLIPWYQAVAYCRWLSAHAGHLEEEQCFANPTDLDPEEFPRDRNANYADYPIDWRMNATRFAFRLPTEAEWEVMCRGRTVSTYNFGSDQQHLRHYAWFEDNSLGRTHLVKSKRPNLQGVFDAHGNVLEWCYDWYRGGSRYGESRVDWLGPEIGSSRVIRGGSWRQSASYCRTADRDLREPNLGGSNIGFRLVVTLPDD